MTRITNNKRIKELFKTLNNKLIKKDRKLKIYLIGGGALMFYGTKSSTKDLDIITNNIQDFELIRNILIELNFQKICDLEPEYKNFELADMLVKEDYRLDIFNKKVCDKLELSENMIVRSKIELDYSNLKLELLSLEDIFVFKSITKREGDIEDSSEIVKKGIDWKIIETEILDQIKRSGQSIWVTFVAQRLEILEERYGIQSPISKKVFELAEKYILELEKNSFK